MQNKTKLSKAIKNVVSEPDHQFYPRKLAVRVAPLPTPQEMNEYERVYKGLAKDIVDFAKSHEQHNFELRQQILNSHDKKINAAYTNRDKGMKYAFILCLFCICASVISLLFKETVFAVGFGVVGIIPIIRSFFSDPVIKQNEEQKK